MSMLRSGAKLALVAALVLGASPGSALAMTKALRCAFAKQRATVRYVDALLACDRSALTTQTPIDPACTLAATEHFDNAFQKAEMRGGCAITGDGPGIIQGVGRFVQQIEVQLQGSCSEAGDVCGGGAPPCCAGLVCSGPLGQDPTCHP
jgi:hypothetical protein